MPNGDLIAEAIIYGSGYFWSLGLWPWGLLAVVLIPLFAWWFFLSRIPFDHEKKGKPKK